MKGIIRKADIVLGLVLIVLCGILCLVVYSNGRSGAEIRVTVDGALYGTYSLSQDQAIDIDTEMGHNKVTIKDGKALMTEADCPDGYCLNQHKSQNGIDASNQTIVCLPNKVVVSVESNSKNGNETEDGNIVPDAVVGTPTEGGETDE